MNKTNIGKAAREVSHEADVFDQVIKGQCRKLIRLMKPVPANKTITIQELVNAMKHRNFTSDFINQIVHTLQRM